MHNLFTDLRYATRMLVKSRGVTLIAVLALALGIGANTAIFSVVNAVLLRQMPYADPDRLVMVWQDLTRQEGPQNEFTNPADFKDWREQSRLIGDMAALSGWGPTLTSSEQAESLNGATVTFSMFPVLGVQPALGRSFTKEEDMPNGPSVVVLSHGLWQRRFGSDPNVVGQKITLNGMPYKVVGVMPQDFVFPVIPNREIWTPMQLAPVNRGSAYIRVIGRMKPEVERTRAQAEMSTIAAQIEQQYPATNTKSGIWLQPLHEAMAQNVRPALLVLLAAVGLVLLIACANIANLLLARAAARRREIGIRLALGAGRGRVIRQLLTESCLLGILGGSAGILVAVWGVEFLSAALPDSLASFVNVQIDAQVLVFTLLLSVLTGLLFGLVPALQATRPNLSDSLQEGSRGSTSGRRSHLLRSALVVTNFALALTLAVGAGLLLKSFVRLRAVDAGFRTENLLTVSLALPQASYPETQQIVSFYDRLLTRLRSIPGVRDAVASSTLPLQGNATDTSFIMEGRPEPPPNQEPVAWFSRATPGLHEALGIPLLRGRAFTEADVASTPRVIIVNEAFVRRHFPNQDPIGKRIGTGPRDNRRWWEIVGVVGNVKFFGLNQEQPPSMYLAFAQVPARGMLLAIRTEADPLSVVPALRSEVVALDKNLAISNIAPMSTLVESSIAQPRLTAQLTGVFAALALLLAAVGIYGVMSYSVSQRTHEIGIRMALGADAFCVLRMVLRYGLALASIGVLLGLTIAAAAFGLTEQLASQLFEVSPLDLGTFAGVAVLLVAVGLLACWLPARRATRVDPMIALRYE